MPTSITVGQATGVKRFLLHRDFCWTNLFKDLVLWTYAALLNNTSNTYLFILRWVYLSCCWILIRVFLSCGWCHFFMKSLNAILETLAFGASVLFKSSNKFKKSDQRYPRDQHQSKGYFPEVSTTRSEKSTQHSHKFGRIGPKWGPKLKRVVLLFFIYRCFSASFLG